MLDLMTDEWREALRLVKLAAEAEAGTPERELAELMKHREFSVKVDLGEGNSSCTIWTGDFTYEYVKINADYHT